MMKEALPHIIRAIVDQVHRHPTGTPGDYLFASLYGQAPLTVFEQIMDGLCYHGVLVRRGRHYHKGGQHDQNE